MLRRLAALVVLVVGAAPTQAAQAAQAHVRVAGGAEQPAPTTALAFFAALQRVKQEGELVQYCGASVVGEFLLLTSASCVFAQGKLAGPARIMVGGSVAPAVERLIPHPDFDPLSLANNVALIKLKEAVSAAPVGLSVAVNPGSNCTLVGSAPGGAGATLRNVSMRTLSESECLAAWPSSDAVQQWCVSAPPIAAAAAAGACGADRGSPVLNQAGRLVGLVSAIPPGACVSPGQVDLLQAVSAVQRFLTDQMTLRDNNRPAPTPAPPAPPASSGPSGALIGGAVGGAVAAACALAVLLRRARGARRARPTGTTPAPAWEAKGGSGSAVSAPALAAAPPPGDVDF
jgi:secreted trypsin-like serine protease